MEEVAHLVIKVSASRVKETKTLLQQLGLEATKTTRATDGLVKAFAGLAAAFVGFISVRKILRDLISVQREFDILNAALITATGSAEGAAVAFSALQDFAYFTPYDLDQVTDAFVKLVNYGLDPSERALYSYGNTASALGKDLIAFVNAVANATVGEFETLKSFGIKARKEAEGVAFMFQGQTKIVEDTAEAIQEYLISLGENEFAGAMEERLGTLDDTILALEENWKNMLRSLSQAGAGENIAKIIQLGVDALREMDAFIASGALNAQVGAIISSVELMGVTWSYAWTEAVDGGEDAVSTLARIGKALHYLLAELPAMGTATVKTATSGISTTWEQVKIRWKQLKGEAFNFDSEDKKRISKEANEAIDKLWADRDTMLQPLIDNLVKIQDEGEKAMRTADELYKEYKKKKEEMEKLREAGLAPDRTKQFSKEVPGQLSQQEAQAYAELEKTLRGQNIAAQLLYEERYALIEKAMRAGREKLKKLQEELQLANKAQELGSSDILNIRKPEVVQAEIEATNQVIAGSLAKRNELIKELDKRQVLEQYNATQGMIDFYAQMYEAQQMDLQNSLDQRLISEDAFHERSKANWEDYMKSLKSLGAAGTKQVAILQMQMQSQVLTMAADLSAQMSNLVKDNKDAARAMFVVSKGIAIAQAIVNTELGATQAMALGPAGIPMASWIRALGYSSVALIAATSVAEFAGMFDHGGMIGAGKWGIAGENGPEIVRGPAHITSTRNTADRYGGGSGSGDTQVVVHNYTGQQASVTERNTPDGKTIEVIVGMVERDLSGRIARGGSLLPSTMEKVYGVKRGGQR